MKKSLWILAALGLVLAATSVVALADEKTETKAAEAAEKAPAAKAAPAAEATFTGEVLDLTCYASHPETGSGEAHASCAKTCLEKGLPAGLLVGDKVYLLVMKDHSAPNKTFASLAAQKVTVKGIAKDVNGTQILTVTQVVPSTESKK